MEKQCPQCGAEQPSGEEWQQQLCPACLMKLGMSGAIPRMSFPEAEESEAAKPAPAPEVKPRRRTSLKFDWRWAAGPAMGALVLALVVLAAQHLMEREPPAAVVRFTLDVTGLGLRDFAVSPDGRSLAYTAVAEDGESTLSVRALDMLEARPVPGSIGASMPFWSPDSRSIGFFASGKLKTVRMDGAPPVTVADAPQPRGGAWGIEGAILFASGSRGLRRVSSGGGEVTVITSTSSSEGGAGHYWPQFLPDGRHFLVSAVGGDSGSAVVVGSLDSGEMRTLIRDATGGVYSDGRILFVRDGILITQTLDANRFEVADDAQTVHGGENMGWRAERSPPYSAGGGVLAYRSGGDSSRHTIVWMDRAGGILRVFGESPEDSVESGFALSPDARYLFVTRRVAERTASDLWLLDIGREAVTSRLTLDGRGAASPVASPDGRRVLFVSGTAPRSEIRAVTVDGSGTPDTLLSSAESIALDSFSPDGRFLLYTKTDDRESLWVLPLEGERKPMVFLEGAFDYKQGQFSPDGRSVAYVSNETGRDEVYVRGFPASATQPILSVGPGAQPLWHGNELFFVSPQRILTAVETQAADARRLGAAHTMFSLSFGATYQITRDGQRFVISAPAPEHQSSAIQVVLNWR
jgi:Tol biopolymer transport system component